MRRFVPLFAGVVAAAFLSGPAVACDFPAVKAEIDKILDRDAEKGAHFRREVASGADSLKVIFDLVPAPMREPLDVCRFFAAEYLAKRGFPPAH